MKTDYTWRIVLALMVIFGSLAAVKSPALAQDDISSPIYCLDGQLCTVLGKEEINTLYSQSDFWGLYISHGNTSYRYTSSWVRTENNVKGWYPLGPSNLVPNKVVMPHSDYFISIPQMGIRKESSDALFAELKTESAHVLYGTYPPVGGMGAIADAIVARLGADDLAAKLERYLRETPLLAPPLAALLRHEPPPAGSVSLAGDALHAALVRLMRALAAERPLVWVIEDLHFADADQRKVALSLARAVEGHRVLLVLTSRPTIEESELAHFDRLENLRRTGLGVRTPAGLTRIVAVHRPVVETGRHAVAQHVHV